MEVLYSNCCGLDVHKKALSACIISTTSTGQPEKELQTFGTTTDELLRLSAWLKAKVVTHVAMESTGVYWQPVWNILEEVGGFTLLLVNAHHIKTVPGRKTDMRDCEWLADLLRHGLVKGSFVPNREDREKRELTRYRLALTRERTAEVNRLQKTLEGANIKLGAVATNVVGASGHDMLMQLVAGVTDPDTLAELARGALRKKMPELRCALGGRFGAHQRFLVAQQLAHIDELDERLAEIDAEIEERLRPFAEAIEKLDAIPGIGQRIAEVFVAEVGTDLKRFPTAGHLASWAGMCPGNNESAGKRMSGKTRKGNRYLRAALTEAANAAKRTKNSYLAAQYHRIAARRGKKKATIAVAHSILVIAYHLLKDQQSIYQDAGVHYFDERDRQVIERRMVRRLEGLGYEVTLTPKAA